jgi:hypothetical protein
MRGTRPAPIRSLGPDLLSINLAHFSHSAAQYKRKLKEWGYTKNIKASVCQAIGRGLERRNLTSTSAVILVNGVHLSPRRLQRALRRHPVSTFERKRAEGKFNAGLAGSAGY